MHIASKFVGRLLLLSVITLILSGWLWYTKKTPEMVSVAIATHAIY